MGTPLVITAVALVLLAATIYQARMAPRRELRRRLGRHAYRLPHRRRH